MREPLLIDILKFKTMGLIKEPLNVDFYFDGKQMTDDDQKRVSEYIIQQKALKKIKSNQKHTNTNRTSKSAV
jgi:hypothetical protein